jgi:hypothetical protein
LAGGFVDCWLVGWLVRSLVCRLVGLVGLVDWFVGWLVCWVVWFFGWLVCLLVRYTGK